MRGEDVDAEVEATLDSYEKYSRRVRSKLGKGRKKKERWRREGEGRRTLNDHLNPSPIDDREPDVPSVGDGI